jgi:hypothetical protein
LDKRIQNIFQDQKTIQKIQEKLPRLFQIAEIESSRAGKIGMEVGSLRERIIVAFMIYKFGEKNVNSEIPITESEVDVRVFDTDISIKTITGNKFSGVKLIWTVDAESVKHFKDNYKPHCDILFIQIVWNKTGGLYYLPIEVQEKVYKELGSDEYIKLPKAGTNPRGAEFSSIALEQLVKHHESHKIPINWHREDINFNTFNRWVELWQQD